VLALGLFAAGSLDCDGSSLTPQETCNQVMAAVCQKMSECGQLGGVSVADCTKAMQANNCSSAAIARSCPAGSKFQANEAQKCIDEQKSQSCTDLANGVEPSACALVCTAGGGGGASGGGGTGGGGGAGGMGGGGGGSTTSPGGALDACKQTMAIMCQKTSTCLGAAGLSALGYTSVDSCTTGTQATVCADVTQTSCAGGETYYPDQARTCLSALPSLSCTDFSNNKFPSACDLMCQ
jgi:hypothetical protein